MFFWLVISVFSISCVSFSFAKSTITPWDAAISKVFATRLINKVHWSKIKIKNITRVLFILSHKYEDSNHRIYLILSEIIKELNNPNTETETNTETDPIVVTNTSTERFYATWLRNTSLINTQEKADIVIQNLLTNNIDTLYLQINRDIDSQSYIYFIQKANQNNILVHALDGADHRADERVAATDKSTTRLKKLLNWLIDYNEVNPDIKFAWLHLDVEVYTSDGWDTDREQTILNFQKMTTDILPILNDADIVLDMDIPRWYDGKNYNNSKFGSGNLAEWIIKTINKTTLMDYVDTADRIARDATDEINYGIKYWKEIGVWVETKDLWSSNNSTTFFEEGPGYMYEQIDLADEQLSIISWANYSFAIHHYKTLLELKP